MRTKITILFAVLCACRERGAVTVVVDPIRVDPVALDFGDAFVGYEAHAEAVLTNPNKTPVDVVLTREGAAFTLPAERVTVEGGVALRLKLVFRPQGPGAATGTLTANGTAVALSGTGVAVPDCGAPPTCHSVAFDPNEGRCVPAALAEGSLCTASFACFRRAECHQGQCLGVLDACDDQNQCTADACGAQGCAHGPIVCPASTDPCLAATCVAAVGCTTEPVDDGTPCGAVDCARARVCINGACVSRPVPQTPVCTAWEQESYLKASNSGSGDAFGRAVAVSADGSTLAVSAWYEDANDASAPGNNSAFESGAVYVYGKQGLDWVQRAFLKASNANTGDRFGAALALSADGNTLAVGSDGEDSGSSNPNSNSAPGAGAVYVFKRTAGGTWYQQAYLKAAQPVPGDSLGVSVGISATGTTVVAGLPGGNQGFGGVQVWEQTAAGWTPSPPLTHGKKAFGTSVAISGDGNTLAGGAPVESTPVVVLFRRTPAWTHVETLSDASAVLFGAAVALSHDGDTVAVGAPGSTGAAHVFRNAGTAWSAATVKGPSPQASAFGEAVALSADGETLVVGAPREGSAGVAHLFSRTTGTWAELKAMTARVRDPNDLFGGAVALSSDGLTVVLGAVGESSSATTVDGDEKNNTATYAGAAYVF